MEKLTKLFFFIFLGAIMFFAEIAPNDAVSNLSKWITITGIPLPDVLKDKAVDTWIFYICLILIIFFILLWIVIPLYKCFFGKEFKDKINSQEFSFVEDPGFYIHEKTQIKYCGKCFSQNKLNPLSFHAAKGVICRQCGESYISPYDYESAWKQASKEKEGIKEKINLEYLRDTAHEWIKAHPAIKSIYLVTANRTDGKEINAHYRYTLIAIVPSPDADYRTWASGGFEYNFREDDVRDCGLRDYSWVTFANMDEAQEYVDENIKDNLQVGARVKWDNLTPQKEETVMVLPTPPFVSIQRAAKEFGVPDEDVIYNLKEGNLDTYLPQPRPGCFSYGAEFMSHYYGGKLAAVGKVVIPFRIEGDKIYYQKFQLLAEDTMKMVDEVSGGDCLMKDVLISFTEIKKLIKSKE